MMASNRRRRRDTNAVGAVGELVGTGEELPGVLMRRPHVRHGRILAGVTGEMTMRRRGRPARIPRAQIVDIGVEIAGERRVAAVTMMSVAAELGVAVPSTIIASVVTTAVYREHCVDDELLAGRSRLDTFRDALAQYGRAEAPKLCPR